LNTGVYTITNIINNKVYVGSALVSFSKRRNQHFSNLKLNKHTNLYLQRSYNKYGKDNFVFEILESYDPDISIDMERYWINILNSKNPNYGYNINDPKNCRLGLKHSEESKLKMHYAQLGEKHHLFGKNYL
jgi:group I intron endonuclease